MNRITSMAWFVGGLFLSAISVLTIGYLTIQIVGIGGGAVFGIDNQLAAVTEPGPALLQRLAVAAIAGASLALLALAVRHRPKVVRALFRSGFLAATVVQVAVSAVLSAQDAGASTLNAPRRAWAEGWVVHGGMDSAVHLLLIVALFLLLVKPHGSENTPTMESGSRSSTATLL